MDTPNTEQRILEAAEKEFLRKGYSAARTTEIAEAAGVTHAMLHYYFRSKEKLFDMIIKEKIGFLGDMMFGSVSVSGKPLFEKLEEVVCRHIDFLAANPDLPRFFIGEVYSRPERLDAALKYVKETAAHVIATAQAEIDEMAARGDCRKVNAEMLMLDIVSLNIFSFIAAPVVETILGGLFENRERFLEERKKENVETIMRKLRP